MLSINFRTAVVSDIDALAKIRALNSYDYAYWFNRISEYFQGVNGPQFALTERAIFVATHDEKVVAFAAGHLSTRFNCQGELQWIDTLEPYRDMGIASKLIKLLAGWFDYYKAYKVCVDPGNPEARKFYGKNNAINLNDHWMCWNNIREVLTDSNELPQLATGH